MLKSFQEKVSRSPQNYLDHLEKFHEFRKNISKYDIFPLNMKSSAKNR